MSKNEAARKELATMMASIAKNWKSWFGMGKFACRRKLSNGAVVRVSITMPKLPAKSAQEKAVEDINAGRVPHDKYNCPGCPIH